MKVAHICISAPYIDGWGYQENLLPEYMCAAGVENHIIAPSSHFPSYIKKDSVKEIRAKGPEYSYKGVNIHRIGTIKVSSSLLFTKGMMRKLEEISPDAIFHHNFNCSSLLVASRYAKCHHIPLLVDNHADEINMSGNKIWAFLYYRILIGLTVLLCRRNIYKTFGVTHSRCTFMRKYYGVPQDKIEFLPICGDSTLASSIGDKTSLREKYGIDREATVIISGGKMGQSKGTDLLLKAFSDMTGRRIKLILFGKFEEPETEALAEKTPGVMIFGWCDRIRTLELLKLSDVACWPLLHTTLIEDAISVGTPVVIRKSETSEHLVRNNGAWIDASTAAAVGNAILTILNTDAKSLADGLDEMRNRLDYNTIANRVIKIINEYYR